MIVVFGQPKSGTSMMMRVLMFGGVSIEFDDRLRRPLWAKRYPHGMFETVAPTFTKCFKCANPLQIHKVSRDAKIIYIVRDVEQVVKSWEAIMPVPAPHSHAARVPRMRKTFEEAIAGRNVLTVRYEEMFTDTIGQCERIRDFVKDEIEFDVAKAAEGVDKSLFVQR